MTTTRGEISRGDAGRLNEQLTGKVWLCQRKSEWPVTLCTSESQVITWLGQNPDGSAWEYEITPKRRLFVHRPEPYLAEGNPRIQAEPTKETA